MAYTNKCYTCKFRKKLIGDAHSKCVADPLMTRGLVPEFSEYGISQGWALWPYNFDPVWLNRCDLYEAK